MASKNLYHRRLVAQSSAKACILDYKPTTTVLITPDNDDYFYICPGHLKDRNFATAKDEEDLDKKKKDEEIQKEIEAVKKEFEEKMRKKLDRRRQKEYEKDGGKGEDPALKKKAEKKEGEEDEEDEKAKEEKLKELEGKKEPEKASIEGPRVFELSKWLFQQRLTQKRQQAQARKTREMLRQPGAFPSVPPGLP